jgi:GxxExxY protein
MNQNDLTSTVIECAINIHKQLGPGLLESVYQECLQHDLIDAGLKVEKEKTLPIIYKDIKLERGYRIDLLIENNLVLELKTVETINQAHIAQTLTYMKLGKFNTGLIINFNAHLLKFGRKRLVM